MHTLLRSLDQKDNIGNVAALLRKKGREPVSVHGVSAAVRSVLTSFLIEDRQAPVLIVTVELAYAPV